MQATQPVATGEQPVDDGSTGSQGRQTWNGIGTGLKRKHKIGRVKVAVQIPITLVEASDGFEALELLKSMNYKVLGVITDLEMPNMDGIELVKQIRNEKNKGNK